MRRSARSAGSTCCSPRACMRMFSIAASTCKFFACGASSNATRARRASSRPSAVWDMCSPFRSSGFERPSGRAAAAHSARHFHDRCRRGRARQAGISEFLTATGQHRAGCGVGALPAPGVKARLFDRSGAERAHSLPLKGEELGWVLTSERPHPAHSRANLFQTKRVYPRVRSLNSRPNRIHPTSTGRGE